MTLKIFFAIFLFAAGIALGYTIHKYPADSGLNWHVYQYNQAMKESILQSAIYYQTGDEGARDLAHEQLYKAEGLWNQQIRYSLKQCELLQ